MKLNMNSISYTVLCSLVMLGVVASVKVCTNLSYLGGNVRMVPGDDQPLPPTDNSSLNHQEPPFTTLDSSSLMLCARQCQLRSRCQRFIFSLTNGQCSLFSTVMMNTINSSTSQDEVYADNIHSWPSRLAGECENHTCPPNTVCEGNMSCLVTHCVNPPSIKKGTVMLTSPNQQFFDVGKVKFICDDIYRPKGKLICLSDGSWTIPACIGIRRCSHVRFCDRKYGDGEYWILKKQHNNTRARIYCHNMVSKILGEFVTLLEDTYSESPSTCSPSCGRTTYTKISIDSATLEILRNVSSPFSVAPCGFTDFGSTTSCAVDASRSAECGQAGTLHIDLRGTGFTMRSDTQWDDRGGATPVVTHSDLWDVVDVACYANNTCTTCLPVARTVLHGIRMFLEISQTTTPATNTAVVPKCPYI